MARIHDGEPIGVTETKVIFEKPEWASLVVISNIEDGNEARLGSSRVRHDNGIPLPVGAIARFSGDEIPSELYAVSKEGTVLVVTVFEKEEG